MADIVLRTPLGELRRMLHKTWDDDRDFGRLFPRFADLSLIEDGALALDVSEEDGQYLVRASVPGFKRDEIEVHVGEGRLEISAEHAEEKEEKAEHYLRRERFSGSLMRRIALPGVDHDSEVDAVLKDGVLQLRISVPERESAKKVEVREG